MNESILVLDFGSQTAQLIVRRIRELGVYSELLPHDVAGHEAMARAPRGIVLSGGPASVYAADAPALPRWLLDAGLPVLGSADDLPRILAEEVVDEVRRLVERGVTEITLIGQNVNHYIELFERAMAMATPAHM